MRLIDVGDNRFTKIGMFLVPGIREKIHEVAAVELREDRRRFHLPGNGSLFTEISLPFLHPTANRVGSLS